MPGNVSRLTRSMCGPRAWAVYARLSGSGFEITSQRSPKLLLRRNATRSAMSTTVPGVVGAPRTKLTP